MSEQRKRRRNTRKRRSNRRRQRGGNWTSSVYGGIGEQHAQVGSGNLIAAVNPQQVGGKATLFKMGGNADLLKEGGNAELMKKGGNADLLKEGGAGDEVSKLLALSAPKTGGKGVLTDVAVPAVLLYANNMVYRKKGSKSKRRHSRHRKYRK